MRGPFLIRDGGEGDAGFSLLEALVSITFLTIVVVSLLQSMAYCLRISGESERSWRESLSKWNEVQELRSGHNRGGKSIVVHPQARPMAYHEVPMNDSETVRKWGVLRTVR